MSKGVHQRLQLPVCQVDIIKYYSNVLWISLRRARQHLCIWVRGILKRWTEKLRLQMGPSAWRSSKYFFHASSLLDNFVKGQQSLLLAPNLPCYACHKL